LEANTCDHDKISMTIGLHIG